MKDSNGLNEGIRSGQKRFQLCTKVKPIGFAVGLGDACRGKEESRRPPDLLFNLYRFFSFSTPVIQVIPSSEKSALSYTPLLSCFSSLLSPPTFGNLQTISVL